MKKIFDWLREQMRLSLNEPQYFHEGEDFYNGIIHAEEIINEAEAKWEAEEKEKPFTVGINVHKQVMWERDIAIEQLHELGYELGEKPREAECCEWELFIVDDVRTYENCKYSRDVIDLKEMADFKFCPYCGRKISEVE